MNRHCSGYTIACPALVTRPASYRGAEIDADDQPCEASVWVTLDGERGTGDAWIAEYVPDCGHEYEDLTPGQQERATKDAIDASIEQVLDNLHARGNL